MISGGDLYNVLSAMIPLYVAMILAYGSVKWWNVLTPVQCGGINRFVAVFAVPLLSFKFISQNDPYTMNFRFIAADGISKGVILILLALWARYNKRGSFEWMITIFMLATLPNTLVMGIPLLKAMYGGDAGALVVQAVVLQCIIWYTLLLFLYEYRAAKILITDQFPDTAASIVSFKVDSDVMSLDGREALQTEAVIGEDGKLHVQVRRSVSSAHGLGLDHLHGRSPGLMSMPSSKALTPRPSNLTGAEIYSLHSSINVTPRESNFNHTDFYSMMGGRGGSSPRPSNFTNSDIYSLHSSRGPTPRTSNFNEDYSKDLQTYARGTSPRTRFPPPVYHSTGHLFGRSLAGGFDGSHIGGVPRGGPYPGQGYGGHSTAVFSTTPPPQVKKTPEPKASTPPRLEEDPAKEQHMFVWSSSASPVSEAAGLHAFGSTDVSAVATVAAAAAAVAAGPQEDSRKTDADAKEARLLIRPPSERTANGAPGERVGPEVTRQNYEDYIREDFSFGNSKGLIEKDEFPEKDMPTFSRKFGSSSTAELTPKSFDDQRKAPTSMPPSRVMGRLIMEMVFRKLIRNPNTYSSLLGITWALVSFRWNVAMPKIIENSISILSDAGLGMAMFSLGLFMALQGRLIVCGPTIAVFAMGVRFLVGPAAMAAASVPVGLKGKFLHESIVQAALPQGIVPFVFAKEYNLHPDILSTAVIFGMLIALPITLLYYVLLGL